jgi:hypothetical protein
MDYYCAYSFTTVLLILIYFDYGDVIMGSSTPPRRESRVFFAQPDNSAALRAANDRAAAAEARNADLQRRINALTQSSNDFEGDSKRVVRQAASLREQIEQALQANDLLRVQNLSLQEENTALKQEIRELKDLPPAYQP